MSSEDDEELTFSLSDTLPGPSSYKGRFLPLAPGEENKIPLIETYLDIDAPGEGTAQDVPSSETVPE